MVILLDECGFTWSGMRLECYLPETGEEAIYDTPHCCSLSHY
jgi:hypothetical protein